MWEVKRAQKKNHLLPEALIVSKKGQIASATWWANRVIGPKKPRCQKPKGETGHWDREKKIPRRRGDSNGRRGGVFWEPIGTRAEGESRKGPRRTVRVQERR